MLKKGLFVCGISMISFGVMLALSGCPATKDILPDGLDKLLVGFGCEGCNPVEVRTSVEPESSVSDNRELPSVGQTVRKDNEGEVTVTASRRSVTKSPPSSEKLSSSWMPLGLLAIAAGAVVLFIGIGVGAIGLAGAGIVVITAATVSVAVPAISNAISDVIDGGGGGGGGGGEEEEAPDPDLLGDWSISEIRETACAEEEESRFELSFDSNTFHWYEYYGYSGGRPSSDGCDYDRDHEFPCDWENWQYDLEFSYTIDSSQECKKIKITWIKGTVIYNGCDEPEQPSGDVPIEEFVEDPSELEQYFPYKIIGDELYIFCENCTYFDENYCGHLNRD